MGQGRQFINICVLQRKIIRRLTKHYHKLYQTFMHDVFA